MTQHVAAIAQKLEQQQALHTYIVKNTFIDLREQDDQEVTVRGSSSRASSAPPSLRCGGDKITPAEIAHVCSSASTSAAGDDEESVDDIQGETALQSYEESEAVERLPGPGVELVLASLLPTPGPPQRATLRAGAKAWRPMCGHGAQALPPGIRDQFAAIVVAAQATLEESATVMRCETIEASDGWALVVYVAPAQFGEHFDEFAAVENAVARGKEAMLLAAESSEKVYVVGYEAMPFTTLPLGYGFAAQLAVVRDEASACWDLLSMGVCHRGSTCRWQHPSWQATVRVSFELDTAQ